VETRAELLAQQLKTWWPGSAVDCAWASSPTCSGYVVQQQRLSIVGLFTGIYGLTGLVWGPKWLKATFFPFFLFAFMVPLGSFTEKSPFPSASWSLGSWNICSMTSWASGVIRSGTQLFNALGTYQYEVAAACGGMRSLISIFLISITYGFLVFRSPWKRLVMVAASLALGRDWQHRPTFTASSPPENGAANPRELMSTTWFVSASCPTSQPSWA
jgi:hypothetical protein